MLWIYPIGRNNWIFLIPQNKCMSGFEPWWETYTYKISFCPSDIKKKKKLLFCVWTPDCHFGEVHRYRSKAEMIGPTSGIIGRGERLRGSDEIEEAMLISVVTLWSAKGSVKTLGLIYTHCGAIKTCYNKSHNYSFHKRNASILASACRCILFKKEAIFRIWWNNKGVV